MVRFRLYTFLFPILFFFLLSFMITSSTKGRPREIKREQKIIHPEESLPVKIESPEVEYIKIPGFCDIELNGPQDTIAFWNPKENKFRLQYEFYIGDTTLATSKKLSPGESSFVNIYDRLEKNGKYTLGIYCKSFGLNDDNQYNSAVQEIELRVR